MFPAGDCHGWTWIFIQDLQPGDLIIAYETPGGGYAIVTEVAPAGGHSINMWKIVYLSPESFTLRKIFRSAARIYTCPLHSM